MEQEASGVSDHEMNFISYISSLTLQALIFLGETPHPVTQRMEKNLAQAKLLIETLRMIKEKTVGNLNSQETNLLESSLHELGNKYNGLSHKDNESG